MEGVEKAKSSYLEVVACRDNLYQMSVTLLTMALHINRVQGPERVVIPFSVQMQEKKEILRSKAPLKSRS